jgi:hypothetical protein
MTPVINLSSCGAREISSFPSRVISPALLAEGGHFYTCVVRRFLTGLPFGRLSGRHSESPQHDQHALERDTRREVSTD